MGAPVFRRHVEEGAHGGENFGYLLLDVGGVFIPCGAGAGTISRLLRAADNAGNLSGGARHTAGQLRQFERQLLEHGPDSLVRSRASLVDRLNEHLRKLQEYRGAGGYTSSVEREIQNFLGQISAIDEILIRGP